MKINQLELYPEEEKRNVTYSSLSINEKINFRANKGMFAGTIYLTRYNYFRQILHRPVIDILASSYYENYRLNSGNSNRRDNYRRSKSFFN